MRRLHQRSITYSEVMKLDEDLISIYEEYEELYYGRDPRRLHFVRQSVHTLLHMAPEIIRMGPPVYYAQWTMERVIGELGREIRQPSNPFANLSQRAVLRAQINSLQAACPQLISNLDRPALPRGSVELEGGYILLRARDEDSRDIKYFLKKKTMSKKAVEVVTDFWREYQPADGAGPKVARWARLRLPNSQVARSRWKEKDLEQVRSARNVKV